VPDLQPFDQLSIHGQVGLLGVGEQPLAAPYKDEESATGVVIMRMLLHVTREVIDPMGQERYLDLRGARVRIAGLEQGDLLSPGELGPHGAVPTREPLTLAWLVYGTSRLAAVIRFVIACHESSSLLSMAVFVRIGRY
jgi:hypothetical protein